MRICRYETIAQQAADDALDRWERAKDAIEAIEWALSRDPLLGAALPESRALRSATLDGARSIGLPTVIALYEVGDGVIIFHDLKFKDSKYAHAGHA